MAWECSGSGVRASSGASLLKVPAQKPAGPSRFSLDCALGSSSQSPPGPPLDPTGVSDHDDVGQLPEPQGASLFPFPPRFDS